MYELANVVPTLREFYQNASDNYEQARTRYINSIINDVIVFFCIISNLLQSLPCFSLVSLNGMFATAIRKAFPVWSEIGNPSAHSTTRRGF